MVTSRRIRWAGYVACMGEEKGEEREDKKRREYERVEESIQRDFCGAARRK
jgi:hypothetical protein